MNPPSEPNYQLGVISGKIDLILVQLAAHQRSVDARFDKVDARQTEQDEAHAALVKDVQDLRGSRAWLLGAATSITTALSLFGSYLMGKP